MRLYTKMDTKEIKIPAGVEVTVEPTIIAVKGPKGSVVRVLHRDVEVKKVANSIHVSTKDTTASARALVGTFVSHIKNMIEGVQRPFVYKLKVVTVHFPMTVSLQNGELLVQNFLGEKRPRKVKIPSDVAVMVQGELITVESPDIEIAGMVATKIEQSTRVRKRDRRTFLDGIFMIEKCGQPITAE